MKTAAIITAFLIAFGAVGADDAAEQDRQIATYCDAVKAGQWPAYKGVSQCRD